MNLPYRSDIDGLRAFAVTSVLIFHAFPSLIPGGFVGVDVFFVISGFLISGIIFKELESSSFSFTSFYARRVKRIFPALIAMLTASYAFGWFFLFNEDFRRLGSHIFRASLFLSNFILWREAGYFDAAAETKPLLHLWSLGIEEQFYIVWPVILWAFWRFKIVRFPLIALLTISSLAWNIYQSQLDLTHDFYSPLTRFWELSAGAWLAFHLSRRPQTHQLANFISGFAVLLLSAAVFVIDSKKAFPGGWALMPVVGAVLLIYAGPTAWCNRVLFSNRIVVWVGAISYPLYLWHWPLLSFARIVEGATSSFSTRLTALVLSVAFAWFTYVCIEKPIRFEWRSFLKTPALVLTMVVVGYVGLLCKQNAGHPDRPILQKLVAVNAGELGQDAYYSYYFHNFSICADERIHLGSGKWNESIRCFQTKRDAPIDLVIIGDSHAEHVFAGLVRVFPHLNMAVYPRSGLPPFVRFPEYKEIFESVLKDSHIKYVLLTSQWVRDEPLNDKQKNAFSHDLAQSLQLLTDAGKRVVLLSDTPKFNFDPQRCKFVHPILAKNYCSESSEPYRQLLGSYLPLLESAHAAYPNVSLVHLDDLFCNESSCRMAADGQIFFRDDHHLNIDGSYFVGNALRHRIAID
jgi:peptidoglycan/LPS O-acetylase OafA/YrhL